MNYVLCSGCERHHVDTEAACPFCGQARRRDSVRIGGLVMAALTPIVLAACYGSPGGWWDSGLGGDPNDALDLDQDGYSPNDGDCDDTDSLIHPDVAEVCDDLVDNDCDGAVDDDDSDCVTR